jgi:vacuolar iron transporter family protein
MRPHPRGRRIIAPGGGGNSSKGGDFCATSHATIGDRLAAILQIIGDAPGAGAVMSRPSLHVEPRDPLQIARHYVRELIYGSNDGIITTFAVVAGVAGGSLSGTVVLICGAANLFADGLSMAVGNYLSIRAHESVLEAEGQPEEEAAPLRHAFATFAAFVVAGALPLLPYLLPGTPPGRFAWSIVLTLLALFAVGAMRSLFTNIRWWSGGLEMLALGAVVALVAYASGAVVAGLISPS